MRLTGRRGHLLAEALCALALSGVLAVAAATALMGARRATALAESRGQAIRSGREVLLGVAALARDAEEVRVEGDTALALGVRIAAGVVCARDDWSLTIPPLVARSGHPLSVRAQPIEEGDELTVLVRDTLAGAGVWWRGRVDSVQSRSAEEPCGPLGGWVDPADAGRPRTRLVTSPSPPSGVVEGAPVRLARPGRLSLYLSGTGEWMLGWRRCAERPRLCGVIQPVAGPVRTPGAGGLRMRLEPGSGGLVVEVRVPGVVDTLRTLVALRDPVP